ncbi:hypothetical protein V6N12_049014 [Hibiscus sabdariffa]|uniref:Uncharacterized protein n=1 Tax=Hibiscus sabdariffa TaxID=183260 RepID=A0ABR2EIZ3_9ROSI
MASNLLLIMDVKALSSSFVACRFRFVLHACNCLAHAMAQEGRDKEEYRFWVVDAPLRVLDLSASDRHLMDPP